VLAAAWFEGAAGVTLACAALAVASGSPAKRALAAGVALLGLFALHPLLERAARAELALSADPVATAAYQVEQGLATPAELGRLFSVAESDPLAARALALYIKRTGDLPAAADYFARLIDQGADGEVLNNAGNVELKRGHSSEAIELYLRAESKTASPVVLFNLSQAYGAAIRLDDQDRALERAQAGGQRVVAQLGEFFSHTGDLRVADAPLSAERVAARAALSPESAVLAQAWRARLAPGWIGGGPLAAGLVCAGVLALGAVAGTAANRIAGPHDFYADIARMLRSGVGDSAQRVAQLTRLRRQHARVQWLLTAIALLVPGAAGLRWRQPFFALLGAACFSGALALAHVQAHALPDPLALGDLRELLAQATYAVLAGLYALSLGLAFWLRAEE
jgi:Tfp pilus assembly protein PilF